MPRSSPRAADAGGGVSLAAAALALVAPLALTLAPLAPLAPARADARLAREPVSASHAAQRGARVVRVALSAAPQREATLSAVGGEWRLYDAGGRTMLARGLAGRAYRVESAGGARLRAVRDDGLETPARDGPFLARPIGGDALVTWNGHRYRGDLLVVATDSGLLVVNQLGVEDYLRGVVPLEIGNRPPEERAAAEAQAVAARSYVSVRARGESGRDFDVVAGVGDQVYGGADAERASSDAAVRATAGEVLTYAGRVVSAPFHAVCGGSTAEPPEVWRSTGEPFLRRVSDRIPGTDRYYCDASPRFHWTESWTGASLDATLERYLRRYAAVGGGGVGRVRFVRVATTTPSGRVGTLAIDTDRGSYTLRGNDIRFVLRRSSGEILSSTYFSVEPTIGRDGRLAALSLRGTGYGHGIGMCQWGAIGRARAGQDYRRILQTYYPGTTIARVD